MNKGEKILKALLYPHPAVLMLLTPLSAALLVYVFAFLEQGQPIHYITYGLSAYTLTVLCLRLPVLIRFCKTFKQENRYIVRYLSDTRLRVNLSLYGSLLLNAIYAIWQLGLGFYHHTVWYYSLAGYYMVLGAIRFFLLKYTRVHTAGEDRKLEWLLYRFCGMLLLLINLALTVILSYIVAEKQLFEHHEITTIAMATYTFATLTKAIIQVFRYRRYESPVFSASKAVGLSTALVSVITLESAMLTAFGEPGSESFRLIMMAATGFGIFVFILGMAIYMLVHSTKHIKEITHAGKGI